MRTSLAIVSSLLLSSFAFAQDPGMQAAQQAIQQVQQANQQAVQAVQQAVENTDPSPAQPGPCRRELRSRPALTPDPRW